MLTTNHFLIPFSLLGLILIDELLFFSTLLLLKNQPQKFLAYLPLMRFRLLWKKLIATLLSNGYTLFVTLCDTWPKVTSISNFSWKSKTSCEAVTNWLPSVNQLMRWIKSIGSSIDWVLHSRPSLLPFAQINKLLFFCDLIAKVQGRELFIQSLHGTSTPPIAFVS